MKNKITVKDLIKQITTDGEMITREFFPVMFSIWFYLGQYFRIENEGSKSKITQIEKERVE